MDAVFTPGNEPYLGRKSVYHFDQMILSCLSVNRVAAEYSHQIKPSELQVAACQIIPQGVNLALSIRELVRQGYLFGALVLVRPLMERSAIISYLVDHTDAVTLWRAGWPQGKRPGLARILDSMQQTSTDIARAKRVAEAFGHIVHGDPIGADWNLIQMPGGALGYSAGKSLNDGDLCDMICFNSLTYLIVLGGMMMTIFPDAPFGEERAKIVQTPSCDYG